MKPIIGFTGMTHLGLNSAAAALEKGFQVVCFDHDPALIEKLQNENWPVVEPNLPETFQKNLGKVSFSATPGDLQQCDVVYMAADVPTDENGTSDLSAIQTLINLVIPHIRANGLLVILCQVPPGFTRGLSFPKERLFYQVETLIFGLAIERALYPERFIVGCADSGRPLPPAFQEFLSAFGCPILPMRYESAELAKISINCCLVAMVSVANTLAELCERLGANWGEIVPALKLDKRIGPYSYLTPGLGIAGGNLERDLATICRLSEEYGTNAGVVRAWVTNSQYRRDWVLRVLHAEVLEKQSEAHVGILGLAYKENTHSTKNSPSLALIEHIKPWLVRVYDPVVSGEGLDHPNVYSCQSAIEVGEGSNVLIIMTPWQEFKDLKPKEIVKAMKGRTVIDPYGVLNSHECAEAGLSYFTLGMAHQV